MKIIKKTAYKNRQGMQPTRVILAENHRDFFTALQTPDGDYFWGEYFPKSYDGSEAEAREDFEDRKAELFGTAELLPV